MTLTLIRKELLDNLLSFRFAVSSAIVVFIMTLSVATLSGDHVVRRDSYLRNRDANFKHAQTYDNYFELMFSGVRVDRPPETLEIFHAGAEKNPNRSAAVFPFFKPSFRGELNLNPVFPLFPSVDLSFAVSLVMSLLAFVFSYDAVCGERENGTLKLLMSYSIPRDKVILAKWAGGYIALCIPFLIGTAVCGLIVLIDPRLSLSGQDWGAALIAGAVGLLFVGVMYSVGLLVSIRVKQPGAAISVLLFLWVIFALVVPNAAPFVAQIIKPIEPPSAVMSRVKFKTGGNLDILLNETIKTFEDATGYSLDEVDFGGNQPEEPESESDAGPAGAQSSAPSEPAAAKETAGSGAKAPETAKPAAKVEFLGEIGPADLRELKASGCRTWADKKLQEKFGMTLDRAATMGKEMGYDIDVDQILSQCESRKRELIAAAASASARSGPSTEARNSAPVKEKVKPQEAIGAYMKLPEEEKFKYIDRMYQNTINAFKRNSEIDKDEQEKRQKAVDEQVRLTEALSRVSPVSAYIYAVTDIANTGVEREKDLTRYLWTYQGQFLDFLTKKFNAPREERVHSIFGGFFREAEYDLADFPRFDYKPMPLQKRISIALIDIFTLFAFMIIFFLAAFVSFLRADIID